MTSRLTGTVIDCENPEALAGFWTQVLDYVVLESSPEQVEIGSAPVNDADHLAAVRSGPIRPHLVFEMVPERKEGKNRLHFDVSPIDISRDEEVARIEALGGHRADPDATFSWVVMRDPEGNEFCVLRSLAPEHFSLG